MSALTTALETLAGFRLRNSRASQKIFEAGLQVWENGTYKRQGDEAWTFCEQLALASIDIGRTDVADQCISALAERFPKSPRVDCLIGIRKEATESAEHVMKYYDELLDEDDSNAVIWKRKISLYRQTGKAALAIEELATYLDTFYTDAEGWLELADLYASCNQYTSALQSLQHALLLAPQNGFYVLQAAETAYTSGDIPLAIRMFLTAVDMTDSDQDAADSIPEGITVRGWYGVKLCTRKLIREPRLGAQSASQTPAPQNVKLLDELATERLLTAYSSANGKVTGREALVRWLEAK